MKRGNHEFLTAFVLFIRLDQTKRIQTSLEGKGKESRGISYSSVADSSRLWMEDGGKRFGRKKEEKEWGEFRGMFRQQGTHLN